MGFDLRACREFVVPLTSELAIDFRDGTLRASDHA